MKKKQAECKCKCNTLRSSDYKQNGRNWKKKKIEMYRARGGGGGASEMGTLSQQPMTSNFAPKQGGSHLQDNYQPQTRHSGNGHLQQSHLQQSHLQQGNHQPGNLQQGQIQQGHLQAADNYHPRSSPSHTTFNCNPTQTGPSPIQNLNQRPSLGPGLSQNQRQMSHLQRGASLDLPAQGEGSFSLS